MTNPARTDMPVSSGDDRPRYEHQSLDSISGMLVGLHDRITWAYDTATLARIAFEYGWNAAAARAKKAREEQGW